MSIEERLEEIRHAIGQARVWLNCIEALTKQLVEHERPSLELLARAFAAAGKDAHNPGDAEAQEGGNG